MLASFGATPAHDGVAAYVYSTPVEYHSVVVALFYLQQEHGGNYAERWRGSCRLVLDMPPSDSFIFPEYPINNTYLVVYGIPTLCVAADSIKHARVLVQI
jgi:hypothetical protein